MSWETDRWEEYCPSYKVVIRDQPYYTEVKNLKEKTIKPEYPPAPWKLQGSAVQTLQRVRISQVRPLIPSELKIVSLSPGKTLGGVFLASYRQSPVKDYSELGVIAALVRHSGMFGLWTSHIYVDNAHSLAAGRKIWGLPKELGEFTWGEGEEKCVTVHQGERMLCTLSWGQQLRMGQMRFSLPSFTVQDSHILFSRGETKSRLSVARARLAVPAESPFAMLGLGRTCLMVSLKDMELVANIPQSAGPTL